jgi:hypothetical protein
MKDLTRKTPTIDGLASDAAPSAGRAMDLKGVETQTEPQELTARRSTLPEIATDPPPASSASQAEEAVAEGYTEDDVRRRAYELYLERNGEDGSADLDWYAAEQEYRTRNGLARES